MLKDDVIVDDSRCAEFTPRAFAVLKRTEPLPLFCYAIVSQRERGEQPNAPSTWRSMGQNRGKGGPTVSKGNVDHLTHHNIPAL